MPQKRYDREYKGVLPRMQFEPGAADVVENRIYLRRDSLMTILVVEDDMAVRKVIVDAICSQDRRITVIGTGNLHDAIRFIPEADSVICDGSFPESVGGTPRDSEWVGVWEACREVKKLFVMFTGNEAARHQAKACGVATFAKPGELRQAIRCVLPMPGGVA